MMRLFQGLRARADWLKIPELPKWWKAKDKTAERRAAASRVNGFLIAGCFIAAIAAATVEAGFMALFVMRAVGDVSWVWNYAAGTAADAPRLNDWAFAIELHPLMGVLLFAASCVVVWFSIFWIPSQIALRGQGPWRRLTMVAVGIFCNLIIIVGSIIVQYENRVEDIRGAVVVEQQAAQGRAALQARVDIIQRDLDDLAGEDSIASPSVQMQACRAGVTGWRTYVAQARRQQSYNLQLIERAMGAAERCDQLREQRAAAMAAVAAAPVEAETARDVEDDAGAGLASFTAFADAYRPVGIALALSLIGILGAYWGFGLMQARALLDPDAPEEEAKAEAEAAAIYFAASNEDEKSIAPPPPDEFDLPKLADWRAEPEPDFHGRSVMVDEAGRAMRQVAGHWRVDDRAAPASPTDVRRPAAPLPPSEPPMEDGGEVESEGDLSGDPVLDELLANAQAVDDPPADDGDGENVGDEARVKEDAQ